MLKIDKCPICNGELSYKMKGYVSCPECHYQFSKKGDAIVLDDATPKHIVESFKFIEMFNERKPNLVLSPIRLFEPGFKVDACTFSGTDASCDTSKYLVDLKPYQIYGMKLIAANGILADGLFNKIRYHMDQGFDNPLLDTYVTPEHHFAAKLLMANDLVWKSKNCNMLAEAYIQPNLEGLYGTLYRYAVVDARYQGCDDLAIYSYYYCEPHVKYDWFDNVELFIKSLSDDLKFRALSMSGLDNDVSIPEALSSINGIKLDDKMSKEFLLEILNACPCTAINSGSFATISSSTIKYHNPLLEYLKSSSEYNAMNILNEVKLAQALYFNLVACVHPANYKHKCDKLKKIGIVASDNAFSPNAIVSMYWGMLYTEIKDKDVL